MNGCLADPKVYDSRNKTTTINRLSDSTMHNAEAV